MFQGRERPDIASEVGHYQLASKHNNARVEWIIYPFFGSGRKIQKKRLNSWNSQTVFIVPTIQSSKQKIRLSCFCRKMIFCQIRFLKNMIIHAQFAP